MIEFFYYVLKDERGMDNYDNYFLPMDDLEKSAIFYKKLGLKEKFNFSEKGMIVFSLGDEELAIILKDIKKFPNQEPVVWFIVADTKKEYERLREIGIHFLSEPFTIGTGMAVEFLDPFGNLLGMTDYKD